jgi:hypothetical protein
LASKIWCYPVRLILVGVLTFHHCQKHLLNCIHGIILSLNVDMILITWQEFAYRVDVCHVTRGAPMEHLYSELGTAWLYAVDSICYVAGHTTETNFPRTVTAWTI